MRALVLAIALICTTSATSVARPVCAPCTRGDAVLAQFSLDALRGVAGELARLALSDPLTTEQYAQIVAIRTREPALARVGAIADEELAAVAASLCRVATGACVDRTLRALRCLADRCGVAIPVPIEPQRVDLLDLSARCREAMRKSKRATAFGLGADWGTGWQRSQHPTDGRAWSFGIDARLRFGGANEQGWRRQLGAVARLDRIAGRDEAQDDDANGRDDLSTGSITRIAVLAGPSIVLDATEWEGSTRFARLDVLGGYLSTRTQPDESGPAAGLDLSYQLAIVRVGLRVVQGLGEARDATMVLAHLGIHPGSVPELDDSACTTATQPRRTTSSRLALGFDWILGGYGFAEELGYAATGLGFEAHWYLARFLDATLRGDLVVYPGQDRDRAIHHAVLAGLRFDHGKRRGRSSKTGLFSTLLGGYSHHAGLVGSPIESGAIVDAALGWGGQGRDGALNLRLHGRFGVSPDNLDYRACFLSFGFELRLEPSRWRKRM